MPKLSDAHFDARKAQILEAAGALFALNGFRETQMREVAERASLSTGAVYRYFSSKEALFEAMMEQQRPAETELRHSILFGEGTAMERLIAIPQRFLELPSTARSFERHFRDFGEAASVPFLRAALSATVVEVTSDVEVLVREAQSDGDMDPSLDAPSTALMISSQWVALRFAVFFGGADADDLVEPLSVMIAGLGRRKSSQS